MLERLIGEILEMLLTAAVAAIGKFFGQENAVEFATAIVGLGFIAIGVTAWWLGH